MKLKITLEEALAAIKEQYIQKGFNIGEVEILIPKIVKYVEFELDIVEENKEKVIPEKSKRK